MDCVVHFIYARNGNFTHPECGTKHSLGKRPESPSVFVEKFKCSEGRPPPPSPPGGGEEDEFRTGRYIRQRRGWVYSVFIHQNRLYRYIFIRWRRVLFFAHPAAIVQEEVQHWCPTGRHLFPILGGREIGASGNDGGGGRGGEKWRRGEKSPWEQTLFRAVQPPPLRHDADRA